LALSNQEPRTKNQELKKMIDPIYFVFVAPAILLALAAQWMVRSAYSSMSKEPASMSGAQAARRILDANGLQNIPIERVAGALSDHYDPSAKVVRLSDEVYRGNSMAAVGIAAHEVGHAMQHARNYAPLVIRNLAVRAASFGSNFGTILLMIGLALVLGKASVLGTWIFLAGLILFGAVVVFQLVNLPVEFDASSRAKVQLAELNIVRHVEMPKVSKVLNAAALTYVAATLQAVLTMAYFVFRFASSSRN
jgi:Zn-dependent membrane protease YugP